MGIKAVRAKIMLGDIELDVFQLPCGSYKLSQSEVCEIVEKPAKRMVEIARSEKGQILVQLGFQKGLKTPVEGSKPVTLVSIDIAFQFWCLELSIGNRKALSIVQACGVESIERRADNAFNVIRTEEERNERFVARRDGILSRNFWTDVIDAYMKTHEVSESYRKFVYINVSDYLNKALFGLTSKEIQEHYDVGKNSPRDYFPSDTLKLVDTIEKATGVRVQNNDVCPKQALKDVVMMLGIEPSKDRL